MEELILAIVKPLVDHPEDVLISVSETGNTTSYKLSVNKEDMGRVIGKQGRIAKAMRTVVYAAGSRYNKKLHLEITD